MFGFEILLLVVFALIASLVEAHRRKKKVDHDLDAWADKLGMVRVGNELFGQLDGIPIGARLAFDSPHGTKAQARWTLYARLQPPLDLGLLVSNQNIPVQLPSAGKNVAYKNFGVDFTRRFRVLCDEPERAEQLLSPAVRQLMMQRLHANAMFMVTDSGVAVQTVHGRADLALLRQGLHAVAAIAKALNTAREAVGPARPLVGHRSAWSSFAANQGMQGISAPLCMFGTIEDATVYAYSVRLHADEFQLEVWMRFEEPLALGLLVQPMRTIDRVTDLFGSVDYKLGDELFDETFLVRVSDEAGAMALLDEHTRARLLTISDTVGPLSLTDDGLSIRLPHVPPDPSIVPSIVRQLIDIAGYIAAKRGKQRTTSPYR